MKEKLKNKILAMISSSLLLIAIQTVNSASARHCHQEKEPMSLKKFEKWQNILNL